jgi:hypothetical protein
VPRNESEGLLGYPYTDNLATLYVVRTPVLGWSLVRMRSDTDISRLLLDGRDAQGSMPAILASWASATPQSSNK